MDLEAVLARHAAVVDARLDQILPPVTESPAELHEAMRYSALAPGKRLRPALVLECASLFGGLDRALDAACAVECVHVFSLIHDDLPALDDDSLRRGLPTCHVKFGESTAILAGDALFALAFDVLAHAEGAPATLVAALQELARCAGWQGLAGGEALDVLSEGKAADAAVLADIHRRKTGALIEASCVLGGLFGGASEAELTALRSYGKHLGMAFQIADDLLNESATSQQLGKAAGSDKDRGKLTFVSVHGVESARNAAHQEVGLAIESLERLAVEAPVLRGLAEFSVSRSK